MSTRQDFIDAFTFPILAMSILVSAGGLVIGTLQGTGEALEHGKCSYSMIVHYMPTRIIACELFKRRWEVKP